MARIKPFATASLLACLVLTVPAWAQEATGTAAPKATEPGAAATPSTEAAPAPQAGATAAPQGKNIREERAAARAALVAARKAFRAAQASLTVTRSKLKQAVSEKNAEQVAVLKRELQPLRAAAATQRAALKAARERVAALRATGGAKPAAPKAADKQSN